MNKGELAIFPSLMSRIKEANCGLLQSGASRSVTNAGSAALVTLFTTREPKCDKNKCNKNVGTLVARRGWVFASTQAKPSGELLEEGPNSQITP